MSTDIHKFSLLERRRNFQQNVYKNFHHTLNMLLHYLVKCKHYFEVSLTSNQLLILSQNLLKICLFDLHTSSHMHVPLVICRESYLSVSRTVLSHTELATLSGFWSRQHHSSYHQIRQPQHQPTGLHYLWH